MSLDLKALKDASWLPLIGKYEIPCSKCGTFIHRDKFQMIVTCFDCKKQHANEYERARRKQSRPNS